MADFLAYPARRDVRGMKLELGAIEAGDPVHAIFHTARYGDVEYVSTAQVAVGGELLVGGRPVAGALTKDPKTADPVRSPASDLRAIRDGVPSRRGEEVAADEVAHGDLVSVDLFVHPYGEFTVSGVATEGDDGRVLVGEWILRTGALRARAVEHVRLIARNGEHAAVVPDRRGAYLSDSV